MRSNSAAAAARGGALMEYLCESLGLALFMISAATFGVILDHPSSPVVEVLGESWARRALFGLAMGTTAVALITSPWGKRSGAHMNPATTLTFWSLGKVRTENAIGYMVFQFLGGILGLMAASVTFAALVPAPATWHVPTLPGLSGVAVAFVAELCISALLMVVVLTVSNLRRLQEYTPWFAGAAVATFITLEAPLSGMSMNPARSLASAVVSGRYEAIWIYFTAPPLGMLLGSRLALALRWVRSVHCAKLDHRGKSRCLFRCQFEDLVHPTEIARPHSSRDTGT